MSYSDIYDGLAKRLLDAGIIGKEDRNFFVTNSNIGDFKCEINISCKMSTVLVGEYCIKLKSYEEVQVVKKWFDELPKQMKNQFEFLEKSGRKRVYLECTDKLPFNPNAQLSGIEKQILILWSFQKVVYMYEIAKIIAAYEKKEKV